jgi:hypothetical protein
VVDNSSALGTEETHALQDTRQEHSAAVPYVHSSSELDTRGLHGAILTPICTVSSLCFRTVVFSVLQIFDPFLRSSPAKSFLV